MKYPIKHLACPIHKFFVMRVQYAKRKGEHMVLAHKHSRSYVENQNQSIAFYHSRLYS